jgi:hypothetical protein
MACHNNPNITWKEVYYSGVYDQHHIRLNRFERWNASAKIQHTYRRWYKYMTLNANTLILINSIDLPTELCYYMCKFNYKDINHSYELYKWRDQLKVIKFLENKYKYFQYKDKYVDKLEEIFYAGARKIVPYDGKKMTNLMVTIMISYINDQVKIVQDQRKQLKKKLKKKFINCETYKKYKDKCLLLDMFNDAFEAHVENQDEYIVNKDEEEMFTFNIKSWIMYELNDTFTEREGPF